MERPAHPADADPSLALSAVPADADAIALEDATDEVVELTEGELVALRRQLADGQAALEELERTVVGLQKELHAERERMVALEAKCSDVEGRAKNLSEVLDDSLADREESDRAWTVRLADAGRAAAEAREEADGARLEAAAARGAAEAARREAEEARAETETARREAESAWIEAIEARAVADAAGLEVEALQKEAEASRTEAGELNRALAAAREALAVFEHRETAAEAEVLLDGDTADDTAALARELAEVRADRERLQDELAAELSNLAHALASRDGELLVAKRRIALLESSRRELEEDRERLVAALDTAPVPDSPGELTR